jgi:predicted DCC family thiol-disulfide oxidoreductase YuxK
MNNKNIIIFDGICNFCNKSVNFIIKRDSKIHFVFTPIQSDTAKEIMNKYALNSDDIDSIILIKDDTYFTKSDAVLEILKDLSGYWFLFGIFKIVPKFMTDYCYDLISKNRYRFFGKKDSCMIPTKNLENRFLS